MRKELHMKRDTIYLSNSAIYALYDRKKRIIYYNTNFTGIYKLYLMY